ncbi:MAG: lipopolysaccharide biosynthesis protein [Halobacteriaceae archaeon]
MRDTRGIGIGREALYTLVSKFTMALVGFGGTVVFARVLGASDLGVYRTALAAAFVATQLSGGVGDAVKKRVSEVDVVPGVFLGGGLLVHLAATGVVLLGMALAIEPAAAYFGSPAIAFGVVAVVGSLGLFNVVNRFYAGLGYPARSSWMDTIRSVVTVVAQLALLFAGFRVAGLVAGLALGTLVTAVAAGVAAGVAPARPTRTTLDRIWSFARWAVPNNLLTNLYSSADVLIVTALVGTTAAGLYGVASQLVMPAAFLASSISGALYVKGSGHHSAGEPVAQDLVNSVAYSGLFAVPMLFGVLAMPRAIPRTVFGGEFAAAGPALVGLALFQVGNVYSTPFESIFQGTDRPAAVFRVNLLVTAVHLPLAVAGGWAYGLVGVVGATVAAEALRLAVYEFLAWRTFDRVVCPRPVLEQVGSAVAMFLALEFALRHVSVTGWVALLGLVGGAAALYFGVLFVASRQFRLALRYAVPLESWPFETPPE